MTDPASVVPATRDVVGPHCLPRRVWLVVPAGGLLPLLGAWATGRIPETLFRFPPPVQIPEDYPRFSWWAAGAVLLPAIVIAFAWWESWVPRAPPSPGTSRSRAFPWWGWMALGWTVAWWVLAWNRFPWFAGAQRFTFAPLWLGFIVTVNAATLARGRRGMMLRWPGRWLTLFLASALFWWLFEWLNRFVHNWHYPISARIGAIEYAVHASVCFSTVLPSVLAVREYLATWPALQSRLAAGPRWTWFDASPHAAALLIMGGLAALALTGALPRYFYPALWASPLLLGVGLARSGRGDGWWQEIARGNWRDVGSWALAGLVCGFFWEFWNAQSFARWVYTVPFVDRWHIFAMPALGYTGYLPFGLECGLAVAALRWNRRQLRRRR